MFRDDLKQALKDNHMTRRELAEYLSVAQPTVSNWCTGRWKPKDREFHMICDLFDLKREHYTAERAGTTNGFKPKPYVDPKVKEKVDLSENPYKKKAVAAENKPIEMVSRVEDHEIKKLKADYEVLSERLETAINRWHDAEDVIVKLDRKLSELIDGFNESVKNIENEFSVVTDEIVKAEERYNELNEKIIFIYGMLENKDSSKSFWKRLWE